MVMVIQRKDGTQIPCNIRPKKRPSHRRAMVFQFTLAVAFITLGLLLIVT